MVIDMDFFWIVLQFGAWIRGPGFKIGLAGKCHAANGVEALRCLRDQFVWIAVGQECATTDGPINNHDWFTETYGCLSELGSLGHVGCLSKTGLSLPEEILLTSTREHAGTWAAG